MPDLPLQWGRRSHGGRREDILVRIVHVVHWREDWVRGGQKTDEDILNTTPDVGNLVAMHLSE